MPDSRCRDAERLVQRLFSKSNIFSSLALALMVLAMAHWLRTNRPPVDLTPAISSVRWIPAQLGSLRDGRARIAGAWRLEASDPRVGGFSGLAIDRGRLLGLTDSGMLAWLPLPPGHGTAAVRALPAVAGNSRTKIGRDSEALASDKDGWWVAFEQKHQLIRYDRDFRTARRRIPLDDRGFRPNRGVEALSAGKGLFAYPESSGISDAVGTADLGAVTLERRFGVFGFVARIAGLPGRDLALPLGPLDNAEGLAAQALPGGGTRFWVITDNDQRRWQRTLLVAIDVPPRAAISSSPKPAWRVRA